VLAGLSPARIRAMVSDELGELVKGVK
jgi:hypothetical protein